MPQVMMMDTVRNETGSQMRLRNRREKIRWRRKQSILVWLECGGRTVCSAQPGDLLTLAGLPKLSN